MNIAAKREFWLVGVNMLMPQPPKFIWGRTRQFLAPCAVASCLLSANLVAALPAGDPVLTAANLQSLNAAAVSAFADEVIPKVMQAGKIPGAVFVVARDGRVICEKAYGVADLKTRKPVTTGQTLFRVASISKILTTASALQLVHSGRLDLHRNVNDYLNRFHIAPAFGEPVTLANLLTHSSGFDECQFGYAAHAAAHKLSLRDYLTQHQPARVRPPGQFSVYDNYGFALAGYLVQQASRIPFADYVRKNIFDPLGMAESSFSPDADQRKQLATGYRLDEEGPQACGANYVNIAPAAGLCTSASDMSELLVALLTGRAIDGTKIFPASVLNGLETRQFASQPELPGQCYGFNQIILAGRPALCQPGQWSGFNSVLLLFPKQHSGMFLAYNMCDYGSMARQVSRQFAEHFIPPALTAGAQNQMAGVSNRDSVVPLLGSYLSSRTAHEMPELDFPREIEVTRSTAGDLEINGEPYRELEPLVFEKIHTNPPAATWAGRRVAFCLDDDGRVTHLITQSDTFRRVTWIESRSGRQFLVHVASLVFLSAVVLWPIMAVGRLIFAGQSPASSFRVRRRRKMFSLAARGTALAACLLALWFEISFGLAKFRLPPFADFYGFPVALQHLLWALPLLLVMSAGLAIFSFMVWCKRLWHPLHRIHYTVLTLALGLFLYGFYERHLLFAS